LPQMSHEDAMSVLLLDYKFLRSKEFSFPLGTGRKGSKRGRDRANPPKSLHKEG